MSIEFEREVIEKLQRLQDGVDTLNRIVIGPSGLQTIVGQHERRLGGQLFQKVLIGLSSGLLGMVLMISAYATKISVMETQLEAVIKGQARALDVLDQHSLSLQHLITKEADDHGPRPGVSR